MQRQKCQEDLVSPTGTYLYLLSSTNTCNCPTIDPPLPWVDLIAAAHSPHTAMCWGTSVWTWDEVRSDRRRKVVVELRRETYTMRSIVGCLGHGEENRGLLWPRSVEAEATRFGKVYILLNTTR